MELSECEFSIKVKIFSFCFLQLKLHFSYEKKNTLNRLFTKTDVDHLPQKVAVKKLSGNVEKVYNLTVWCFCQGNLNWTSNSNDRMNNWNEKFTFWKNQTTGTLSSIMGTFPLMTTQPALLWNCVMEPLKILWRLVIWVFLKLPTWPFKCSLAYSICMMT